MGGDMLAWKRHHFARQNENTINLNNLLGKLMDSSGIDAEIYDHT
jgi:hypothetical protein